MTPFGNDRLEPAADGAVWLFSSAPKGWAARRGGTFTKSQYPGTAIRWDTEIFEVVEAIALPDGTQRYRLEPWPDRHTIRDIRDYDAGSEARRSREQSGRRQSLAKRRLSILFAPILGHLPGPEQKRMESEFGAPALGMTIASALPLFTVGFLSFFFDLTASLGAGFAIGGAGAEGGASIPHLLPIGIAVYLIAESSIRLGVAFVQGKPIGSLPGVLVFAILQAAMGKPSGSVPRFQGLPPSRERALEDRFRMLEPLLALLTPAEQIGLAARFGNDPLRWGKFTALLLLTVGGLNVFASLGMLAAGAGGIGDFLWLVAGAALSIEQIARLREIARGRPAGSVLGALVRPIAAKLLETGE